MTPEKILEKIEWIIAGHRTTKSLTADEVIEDIYELICEEFWRPHK